MERNEAVKVLERIKNSALNNVPEWQQALTLAIETLKRIDVENIKDILNSEHFDIKNERRSRLVMDYLEDK